MGAECREASPTAFFRFLESNPQNVVYFMASLQKIFKNDKNIVCIWAKMGYNKVE